MQAHRLYEKSNKEAKVAQSNHEKACKEPNITKEKLDKVETISKTKAAEAEDLQNKYLLLREETNKNEDLYHTSQMFEVLNVSFTYYPRGSILVITVACITLSLLRDFSTWILVVLQD